jgi:hypothetical protein
MGSLVRKPVDVRFKIASLPEAIFASSRVVNLR